ncbi:uncharacterized protein LOC122687288 [Cervus elaphus]|uniref:uncharacterized protein LOC122428641 n=1 Tax=Cervus canadensis TaxID=1574408 RepID=UPI001CA33AB3|nr:uncharacterized protein LOC122428641 [Cervus canadensis]XP_043748583.1 uncharacterized protein LOC122687288 [Cervus elaphus]
MFQGLGDPCPDRTRDESTSISPLGAVPLIIPAVFTPKNQQPTVSRQLSVTASLLSVPDRKQPEAFPEVGTEEGGKAGEAWSGGGNTAVGARRLWVPATPTNSRSSSLPAPPRQLPGWILGTPASRPGGQNSPQPAGRFEGCYGNSHFREWGLGSALEPWAPPRALRPRFSVAPGNSHFRERVQFPPVPPPRSSTASAPTQGSGLPATVSRRSSLSAGGGG